MIVSLLKITFWLSKKNYWKKTWINHSKDKAGLLRRRQMVNALRD